MMYVIIFLVIVVNTIIFGYCLSEFFKKRFREKLEKELQEILNHAEKLDEQLKAAIGDIPQFSKELSDEITPFVKLYVAEAIDKYVAAENEKLRAVLVPAEVQYSDVELLLMKMRFKNMVRFRKSITQYRRHSMKLTLKKSEK